MHQMPNLKSHASCGRTRVYKTPSSQLLLNEERPQMRKLPGACHAQHSQLYQRPSYNPGVRGLRLVPKLGLSLLPRSLASAATPRPNSALLLALWKTCSLLISPNRPFKSLTFCTISTSFPLSVLSIWLVSPIARSKLNLMPPAGCPLLSQPLWVAALTGVKHSLCSPESAALKVKRPEAAPRWFTTRWSLSKTSSTVIVMPTLGSV